MISLHRAHLMASDLGATIAFWCDGFGGEVVHDVDFAGARNVFLRVGGGGVHLYDQRPRTSGRGTVHHLGVLTDELEDVVERLRALGHSVTDIRRGPAAAYAMAEGPDSLLVEIFQPDLSTVLSVTVPGGAMSDRRKAGLVEEAAKLVLDAEGGDGDQQRVWVHIHDIPDGKWGAVGQIIQFAHCARPPRRRTRPQLPKRPRQAAVPRQPIVVRQVASRQCPRPIRRSSLELRSFSRAGPKFGPARPSARNLSSAQERRDPGAVGHFERWRDPDSNRGHHDFQWSQELAGRVARGLNRWFCAGLQVTVRWLVGGDAFRSGRLGDAPRRPLGRRRRCG